MTDQDKLKKQIVKLIKKTFNIVVNYPTKVWVFHWDCGVAYWKKNVDSLSVSNYLLNPMDNLYICGENYSLYQSWVEGSLDSCHKCLDLF